jgi:type 1 glutamine amidotransferase
VTAGLPGRFLISDELYQDFRLNSGIHVLAQGRDKPLILTVAYGGGCVFHTALGHDVDAMRALGFLVTCARGAEWAASGRVTLPAKVDLNPKQADAVRVLLVSGGHDHDASFYSMFETWPDVRVNVDPQPAAFRKDLRPLYDVIVLYDSIQVARWSSCPTSTGKTCRNSSSPARAGGAASRAVDFGKWEWWWKEVVGGRYFLKAEGDYPASKYQHDVEFVATPKQDHPITEGLAQMRLLDETYRDVWHRPDVEVVLTAAHPTSDVVIGWVSPYAESRVVYLQPGHGRDSHDLPWFGLLVHRTMRWAALH